MPQFDFFIWITISFTTILIFQLIYFIILYFILAPFADFQKTLIKLNLIVIKKNLPKKKFSLLEFIVKTYFESKKK